MDGRTTGRNIPGMHPPLIESSWQLLLYCKVNIPADKSHDRYNHTAFAYDTSVPPTGSQNDMMSMAAR
jgi:hypothetical protein